MKKPVEKMRIVLTQAFAGVIGAAFLVSGTYWEGKAPYISEGIFVIGVILAGAGSLGRIWCSLYIAGYKTEKLIVAGPYSMCRNPLYFFSFLGGIGVGLTTETLTIPLGILTAFLLYYPFVMKSEEEQLMILHRDEYRLYCDHVPLFFPRLSLFSEPLEYVVNAKIFRKHMVHALWFIWLIGVVELIEALHKSQMLPVLFYLY